MANTLIVVLAVAFLYQVSGERSQKIGDYMTQVVAKKFEETLNTHMKEIKEVHEPLISIFKEKGCEIPTKTNIASENILHRLEACTAVTDDLAILENSALDSYFIARDYANVSLEAANNATICLENEDIAEIAICLLQGANDFGYKLGELNDALRFTIIDLTAFSEDIIFRFNQCFGTDVSTLQDLTRVHTKRCRS